MVKRKALVGHTGFVGRLLTASRDFDECYNSRNLDDITGRQFDTVICAAAPATMWEANQNPAADASNIDKIVQALRTVCAERLVLISTIAVFDDPSAGYTEASACYETEKAYGRNRRILEEQLSAHFVRCHILRLPALFGSGLKKNFIYDLMNPLPSFIRAEKMDEIVQRFSTKDQRLLAKFYQWSERLGMSALDRIALDASADKLALTEAFAGIGFLARNFTNSRSCFQFYNAQRLAGDIDRVIESGIYVVNICSEPTQASSICEALTGTGFENDTPPIMLEDMRSSHSALFDGPNPYLFGRDSVLTDLKEFYSLQIAQ